MRDSAVTETAAEHAAPRFSVVVPTHQSREYAVAAVRSVLSQTCGDFEVIVVDNGSTDGTGEAIAALGDERVAYRWQEDSGLPADSRNKGVARARGEWVCFLDADDTWRPQKLAAVAEAIGADPGLTLVSHAVQLVDPAGADLGVRGYVLDERPLHEQLLYRGNFLTTSATCVRRSAIVQAGGFDVRRDYFTVEDYDLWLKLAERGARAELLPDVLGDQLIHPGSASSRLARHYDAFAVVHDAHAARLAENGSLSGAASLWRRIRARSAEIRDLAKQGDTSSAARVLVSLPGEALRIGRLYRDAVRRGSDR